MSAGPHGSVHSGGSGAEPPDPRDAAELEALRALMDRVARKAIAEDQEVLEKLGRLVRAGYAIEFVHGAILRWRGPDWAEAERRAKEPKRFCPRCSVPARPWPMRGTVVRDRISAKGDHEVIEGPQIRFRCCLCGYGEVENIGLAAKRKT